MLSNQLNGSIFRIRRRSAIKKHKLTYLFWECTTRCNLNCIHCGSDCRTNFSLPDMPGVDFLKAIETIPVGRFPITIVFTGGEPLLRKDLEAIGREVRKKGFKWSMVSNGMLYDAERHNSLLNAGMGALTISLDGFENSHNWMRNHKSSFQRADQAISIAAGSKRLNFDVVTCVNRRNVVELEKLYAYLLAKNVKAWRLFTIVPIGRAKNQKELLLQPIQFRNLMDFISEKRKLKQMDIKFSCEGYVGKYENKVRGHPFFCRAGINIGSILIDGSISSCPNIDRSFIQGNIYTDNFYEVWQNRFEPFRKRDWTKTGICSNCKQHRQCQGNGLHNWHENKEEVLVCHYLLTEPDYRVSK